jgi:putative SOS response-associated peptidase YedK
VGEGCVHRLAPDQCPPRDSGGEAELSRCLQAAALLIPTDGFYEWQVVTRGPKVPHLITRRDGKPLALAGLWAVWRDPSAGQDVTTCTIITTTANATMRPLHERMPVILPEQHWDAWLDSSFQDTTALLAMLQPSPDDLLTTRPVSRLVNDVKNEGPQLLLPVA